MSRRVYLDHNASTPVHPEVVAEMLPYFGEVFGNPSSVHAFGREARDAVDAARDRVAAFLRARPDEIVFTSGGTESDNFGVKGLAWAAGRGHVITSKIEHHAVLRTGQALEAQGFAVTYLPVDEYGMIDPDDVRRALRDDTIAISIMHANSEVGTIQPVRAIGALAREAGFRTKMAVSSTVAGLGAKGACIGPLGQRVRAVMSELGGEKIDIVDYSEDPEVFIAAALSPARVNSVEVLDEENKVARVVVPDFQLSLAIGKEGQNVRLAARLTGWKIDIRSDADPTKPITGTAPH